MSNFGFYFMITTLCVAFAGEPDLIDSIIYKSTGVKSWEETID